MKLAYWVIAMILLSLAAVSIIIPLNKMNEVYPRTDYDNTTLQKFDKLNILTNYTKDIQNESLSIETDESLADLLGKYFAAGYRSLKTTVLSLDIFKSMLDSASDSLSSTIPAFRLYKEALQSIIIVLIISNSICRMNAQCLMMNLSLLES